MEDKGTKSRISRIQDLALPPCFEIRSDGAIGVTGHRVKLFAILEVLYSAEGASITKLQNAFPTLPNEILAKVMQFCEANDVEMRAYFAEQSQIAEENREKFAYAGPSLAQLRARRDNSSGAHE